MSRMPQSRAEALDLLATVRARLQALDKQYPGEQPIASSLTQLAFVEPYLASDAQTMPRLASINFGFLGVRFVREFDEKLAGDMAYLDEFVINSFKPAES